MRVRIDRGRIDVDLIFSSEEAAAVIKLAMAAGLVEFSSYTADKSIGLIFEAPKDGAWADNAFAAMFMVSAAVNGASPETVLARFLEKHPRFAEEALNFQQAVSA